MSLRTGGPYLDELHSYSNRFSRSNREQDPAPARPRSPRTGSPRPGSPRPGSPRPGSPTPESPRRAG
ncbi:MAG: hypothetical protein GEV11_10800 [Streptosporangiales bacterium]|nr:hypothetical protein [Streptosporangiales bacterium]